MSEGTLVGVYVRGDPFVHGVELRQAEPALAGYGVALDLFRAARVLEMDGLEVVFVGVAPRKNPQLVGAAVAARAFFERAPELALSRANFLPVAFEMAKEVVRPCKPAVAELAHMRA